MENKYGEDYSKKVEKKDFLCATTTIIKASKSDKDLGNLAEKSGVLCITTGNIRAYRRNIDFP